MHFLKKIVFIQGIIRGILLLAEAKLVEKIPDATNAKQYWKIVFLKKTVKPSITETKKLYIVDIKTLLCLYRIGIKYLLSPFFYAIYSAI